MKIEEYINEFIKKETIIEPNPFLTTRIMASIEKPVNQKRSAWQTVIAVASISIVILFGFKLGSLYHGTSTQFKLNINDSQIEMLHYYVDSNE